MLVRRLGPEEWRVAYGIVAQLWQLHEAEFIRRVELQSTSGYELVGVFLDGALVGVMGMRPVHTLARGQHLHIDDLVVDANARGSGAGRALIEFAERDARNRGMAAIFLDARPEAMPFYEALSFVVHSSPSMKKLLG